MIKKNMPTPTISFPLEAPRPPYEWPLPPHYGILPPPREHHLPPHLRMRLEFEEDAWNRILAPWADEDAKNAVFSLVQAVAPPEVQILADQCQHMMAHLKSAELTLSPKTQEVSDSIPDRSDNWQVNPYGWSNPVLTSEICGMYETLYGEKGKEYLKRLETSPYEVAAISVLLAYIMACLEVK